MPFDPRKQILVVDDDVLVLRLVREAVEALIEDCSVDTTPNPEYGFEMILRKPYDLLILDFAMAQLDGASLYSLVSKLFSIHPPEGRKIPPMLLLSGFGFHPAPRNFSARRECAVSSQSRSRSTGWLRKLRRL